MVLSFRLGNISAGPHEDHCSSAPNSLQSPSAIRHELRPDLDLSDEGLELYQRAIGVDLVEVGVVIVQDTAIRADGKSVLTILSREDLLDLSHVSEGGEGEG